ncbi:hypothetical protein K8B33_15980 [Alcanivorax sp. JB21]|uniref:hypothetical protein n=1 Tax=Alcanivorax limicola TaxID=2874102 RepID=UPI001CC152FF|nr:hypothetical protein [Alcanivorax limicola]MBZ2190601.1 hypothetical protein [Alcanivorax limicola]
MISPTLMLGRDFYESIKQGAFDPFEVPDPEIIGDEAYVEIPEAGLSIVLYENGKIQAVHLHSDGHGGYQARVDGLPEGLAFDMSRKQVRAKLGEPLENSEGVMLPVLGQKPAWDAFGMQGYVMHVEYLTSKLGIQLVTLSLGEY